MKRENPRYKLSQVHHIYVDYNVAINSHISNHVFAAMSKLVISAKLIKLGIMTLSNSCSCYANVVINLSETFDTVKGCRKGDHLSCGLYNFVMENALRKAGVDSQRDYFTQN